MNQEAVNKIPIVLYGLLIYFNFNEKQTYKRKIAYETVGCIPTCW